MLAPIFPLGEGFLSCSDMGWKLHVKMCSWCLCSLFPAGFHSGEVLSEMWFVGLKVIAVVWPTDLPGEENGEKRTRFWTHSPLLVSS